MDIFEQRIYELALGFRTALETCPRTLLPTTFAEFPRGSCGDTSLLLGTFLKDNDCGYFMYVSAVRGAHKDNSWETHGWLVQGDLVVDITADQFCEVRDSVIVTRDSEWHRQFFIDHCSPGDFRSYDQSTYTMLASVYDMIVDRARK